MDSGGDDEPIDQIAFLARSPTRVRVLEQLHCEGAATRHDCREELDASRSTVARTLSALEDRGWIEQDDRSYCLTPVGMIVAQSFLELTESIRLTDELGTFLEWFPYSESELDLVDLRDADVTVAAEPEPYAPARRQSELLKSASEFRGLFPSIDLEGTEFVHERITAHELEAEFVHTDSVVSTIAASEYAQLHREMLETGHATLLVTDAELPFYLGLAGDGAVHVGVEDDEGFPRALLESRTAAVREWAESVYERYAADATELAAADF